MEKRGHKSTKFTPRIQLLFPIKPILDTSWFIDNMQIFNEIGCKGAFLVNISTLPLTAQKGVLLFLNDIIPSSHI
jgi:hypothetical protein